MHAGEIAAVTAAGAFVLLVLLSAIPLVKLGRTLDEATLAIRQASAETTPLLHQAQAAVAAVQEHAAALAQDQLSASASTAEPLRALPAPRRRHLGSRVGLSVGSPLLKILAVSYGIRSTALRPPPGPAAAQPASLVTDRARH